MPSTVGGERYIQTAQLFRLPEGVAACHNTIPAEPDEPVLGAEASVKHGLGTAAGIVAAVAPRRSLLRRIAAAVLTFLRR